MDLRRRMRAGAVATSMLVLLLAGCANPGPVRPPSLNLPKVAADVAAERWGGQVRLTWTVPTTTTDGLLLPGAQRASSFSTKRRARTGALAAEICREEPGTAGWKPVARVTVQAGEHARWQENLRPGLTQLESGVVRYRVRILNASGRDAGWSAPADVASGPAPAAMAALQVRPVRRGARITWERKEGLAGDAIYVVREPVGGVADERTAGATSQTKKPERVELSVTAEHDPGGATDTSAKAGVAYRYMVYRRRAVQIDGVLLHVQGDSGTVTSPVLADTFAPPAPAGLLAVATPADAGHKAAVDLSWEPIMEADVAGYQVYRANEVGEWSRISSAAVVATAFHDDTVQAGRRYRYRVTAVDRAGNESAPSGAVSESIPVE